MKRLILAALAALAGSAYAPGAIDPRDAAAYIGQHVIVEGQARIGHSSHRLGVDVALNGRDENGPLFGFIRNENVAQFPDLGRFDGKTVDLDGVVQLYNGVPEILLTAPGQIRVVR